MMKEILYSLVVPLYNECESIETLVKEIASAMDSHLKQTSGQYELILVDDGSTDTTKQICLNLIKSYPFIRLIRLKKNCGQTTAIACGFKEAKGEFVISLDGDGQNDPNDIPKLIEVAKSGYDLVTGRREKREDIWYKRIISKVANHIRQKFLKDGIQDTGCSLKVYRKKSLDQIPLYKGLHRFLPALFLIHGFKIKEIDVNHRKREKGKSKYHLFNRGISLISDLFAVSWMRKRKIQYEIENEAP